MKKKIICQTVVLLLSTFFLRAQGTALKDSMAWLCGICGGSCDTLVFAKPGNCPHCGMELIHQSVAVRKELIENYNKHMTICFYLQDGVEVLDFAGPMEVFAYAGFHVFTVSRTKAPIVTQGILKIMPDYSIEDAPPADIMAFFGGNTGPSSKDSAVLSWIRKRKTSTSYFFSVCTGAFIIGKAGVLDNLTATTFHASIESLRKALPGTKVLSDTRFVDNGNVITTAGISAGIDGALHLVAKLNGEETAREVAKYMEYDKWIPGQGLVVQKK
ncbi:DJ-1/PfpI family protein [Flavitalea sp. BT771]|uniref:DJ-1/PfpI family protein n=1 Tax=Flavitalea sp. BT771 TaxID=3063329 RepID=UPI0026E1488E|nr:DJ-1/PfpI family protein [Flavitalea sp. BT771]MDO6434969.1 DJ-1/PfpI family protein [Flavitalea sp. BT771]MDV6223869.1 DJ-1/PfpI family protein [Flavitalea sp. BT771]